MVFERVFRNVNRVWLFIFITKYVDSNAALFLSFVILFLRYWKYNVYIIQLFNILFVSLSNSLRILFLWISVSNVISVTSFNHLMKPMRRKYTYKRSDNFKATLNQFFNGGKQLVPDNVMKAIRNEIHNRDNILYNYEIPLTIPVLECILKRNKMVKYKNSIYYVFFKLNS